MITSPVDRSDRLVEPPSSMPDALPFEPPIGPPSGPPDVAGAAEPDAPAAPTERSRARWERPALAGLLVYGGIAIVLALTHRQRLRTRLAAVIVISAFSVTIQGTMACKQAIMNPSVGEAATVARRRKPGAGDRNRTGTSGWTPYWL